MKYEYKLNGIAEKRWELRREMYELWHQWLKMSDEAEWDESCREGYIEARRLSFDGWWNKYRLRTDPMNNLFDYAFTPITTVEEFNESNCYPYGVHDFDERIFRIGFSLQKHVLHKALDRLIDQFHTNHATGHKFEEFPSVCVELVKPPTERFIKTVRTILKVYQERQHSPEKSLYEIGISAGLSDSKGGPHDDKKQLLAITISRYLKWADEIAAQLTVGEFPHYNMRKLKKKS